MGTKARIDMENRTPLNCVGNNPIWYDMWYGDDIYDIDDISCSFSDCDCRYRGNLYIKGKMVGDYSTEDSVALEEWVNEIAAEKQRRAKEA